MPRSLTVIYSIHDEDAAKSTIDQLGFNYKSYDPEHPPAVGISAMSRDNEMLRIEKIEQIIQNQHDAEEAIEMIEAVLGDASCQH